MEIYLAPLEGITGSLFRSIQLKHFGGVDKYFTPFISATGKAVLTPKILDEILPEKNEGQYLVPQILTKSSEAFIFMCKALEQYGYKEFNLNLGCPSGTVTAKGKGSGFLAHKEDLDRFLEEIFKSPYSISVKTRIGYETPEEFYELLAIYNKYPLKELIIHPRTRQDMYKNTPKLEVYTYGEKNSRAEVCYNGDIFNIMDYNRFSDSFPHTKKLMIGRGVITDPSFPAVLKGGNKADNKALRDFTFDLYYSYKEVLPGSIPLLHKMKELMSYMLMGYEDCGKTGKKIKKSKSPSEFEYALEELFYTGKLLSIPQLKNS